MIGDKFDNLLFRQDLTVSAIAKWDLHMYMPDLHFRPNLLGEKVFTSCSQNPGEGILSQRTTCGHCWDPHRSDDGFKVINMCTSGADVDKEPDKPASSVRSPVGSETFNEWIKVDSAKNMASEALNGTRWLRCMNGWSPKLHARCSYFTNIMSY